MRRHIASKDLNRIMWTSLGWLETRRSSWMWKKTGINNVAWLKERWYINASTVLCAGGMVPWIHLTNVAAIKKQSLDSSWPAPLCLRQIVAVDS